MKTIIIFALLLNPLFSKDIGIASFYTNKTNFGTKTASGVPFDENKMTAASRFLKMGTVVRVTNLKNKKSVVVRITDWGPHKRLKDRIIDLSIGSFKKICDPKQGLFKCKVEIISKPESNWKEIYGREGR